MLKLGFSMRLIVHCSLAGTLLLMTGCSKSPSNTAVSKAEYIAAQDVLCAQADAASIEEFRRVLGSAERVAIPAPTWLERASSDVKREEFHLAASKNYLESFEKAPQPVEDSVSLKELIAAASKITEHRIADLELSRVFASMAAKVSESGVLEPIGPYWAGAQNERWRLTREFGSLKNKFHDLARKYGFRRCFIQEERP
jgi:hypothetical protein